MGGCVLDVKLEDVPELGYLSSNDPPRGEICVKTKTMFTGYYKDEARTKAAFTEDGYYRTGDIGERRGRELVRYLLFCFFSHSSLVGCY